MWVVNLYPLHVYSKLTNCYGGNTMSRTISLNDSRFLRWSKWPNWLKWEVENNGNTEHLKLSMYVNACPRTAYWTWVCLQLLYCIMVLTAALCFWIPALVGKDRNCLVHLVFMASKHIWSMNPAIETHRPRLVMVCNTVLYFIEHGVGCIGSVQFKSYDASEEEYISDTSLRLNCRGLLVS